MTTKFHTKTQRSYAKSQGSDQVRDLKRKSNAISTELPNRSRAAHRTTTTSKSKTQSKSVVGMIDCRIYAGE